MRRNSVVAAIAAAMLAGSAGAQDVPLDDLFDALRAADAETAPRIVDKIGAEWSKSGSPAMDLLLQRGRDALDEGDAAQAIGHLTALIDHAQDFAEAYNARATAFFALGQYGPAMEDVRIVLALNPRHFGALSGLAIMLDETGRKEGALAAWRAVVAIYPASPQADDAIARLELETGGRTL
ncbi:tetratricopeptide repeat protein [Oceaniovalibus guishaninsula]|nr:hypothetical protein [Oceaniovalibus guishaninsula]